MSREELIAEAIRQIALAHRVGQAFGLLVVLYIVWVERAKLTDIRTAPIGRALVGAAAAISLTEAIFPLTWVVFYGRPVDVIPEFWLNVYIYVGSVLTVLIGFVAVLESIRSDKSKKPGRR